MNQIVASQINKINILRFQFMHDVIDHPGQHLVSYHDHGAE